MVGCQLLQTYRSKMRFSFDQTYKEEEKKMFLSKLQLHFLFCESQLSFSFYNAARKCDASAISNAGNSFEKCFLLQKFFHSFRFENSYLQDDGSVVLYSIYMHIEKVQQSKYYLKIKREKHLFSDDWHGRSYCYYYQILPTTVELKLKIYLFYQFQLQ